MNEVTPRKIDSIREFFDNYPNAFNATIIIAIMAIFSATLYKVFTAPDENNTPPVSPAIKKPDDFPTTPAPKLREEIKEQPIQTYPNTESFVPIEPDNWDGSYSVPEGEQTKWILQKAAEDSIKRLSPEEGASLRASMVFQFLNAK
jgi:hypothetical protein